VENSPLNRIDADGHELHNLDETGRLVEPGCIPAGMECALQPPDPQVAQQTQQQAQNQNANTLAPPMPSVPDSPSLDLGKVLAAGKALADTVMDAVGVGLETSVGVVGSLLVLTQPTANESQDTIHIPASSSQQGAVDTSPMAAHNTGGRESTREDHEKGEARAKRDQGGEKGDKARRDKGMWPRRPPGGKQPKGGWPPKDQE
jgi:hypothetical protein